MRIRTVVGVAAVSSLVGLAPRQAEANVIDADWLSSTLFNYRVVYVPDFDQSRSPGLPGNGSNYCVPTSFMNWAAYIARRGNPGQSPGLPPYSFTTITNFIFLLGVLQGTDPNGGTGPTGGVSGATNFYQGRAFIFAVTGNTSAGFPRLTTIANLAINNDALIIPRVGWYNVSNFPVIVRNGGHAVSMVKAQRSGADQIIGIHDPAWTPSGDTLSVQSTFTRNEYVVQDLQVIPLNNGLPIPSTMSRINGYGSGSTNGYIYGYYAILPTVVLTPIPNFPSLRLLRINFANPGMPESETISNPEGRRIRRGMYGMNPSQIFYAADAVAGPGSTMFHYDMTEDTHTPLVSLPGAFRGMTTSRFGRAYMRSGDLLICLNADSPGGDYVEASMNVDPDTTALAFDDFNDEVVLLDPRARQLLRYPADLPAGVPPVMQDLPANVPVSPVGTIDIRPGDGSVLIGTTASTAAFLLLPAIQAGDEAFDVEVISIPGNNDPISGGSFTDMGVLLSAGGVGYEMMKDDNGRWVLADDSPFTGLPIGGQVFAGRSRTDVDRDTEMDPENADVLPDDFSGNVPIVECPADVNADGVVNFADLNIVLSSFGQVGAGIPGDVNGDDIVDFEDLNAVLSFFGVDCF